jgi:hypothetical protein
MTLIQLLTQLKKLPQNYDIVSDVKVIVNPQNQTIVIEAIKSNGKNKKQ